MPRERRERCSRDAGYLMLFTTGPENTDRHTDLLTQTMSREADFFLQGLH